MRHTPACLQWDAWNTVKGTSIEDAKAKCASPLLTDELLFKLSRSATNGKHDKLSFLVEMLVHTDLVQRIEISLLLDYFELLDQDKSGDLVMAELETERERVRLQEVTERAANE